MHRADGVSRARQDTSRALAMALAVLGTVGVGGPGCSARGGGGGILDPEAGTPDGAATDGVTLDGGMPDANVTVASCLVSTPAVMICEEFHDAPGASIQSVCDQTARTSDAGSTGAYSLMACARTGTLGGCVLNVNGMSLITWYYGAASLATPLAMACASANGSWVIM